jgi:hypothetical protein
MEDVDNQRWMEVETEVRKFGGYRWIIKTLGSGDTKVEGSDRDRTLVRTRRCKQQYHRSEAAKHLQHNPRNSIRRCGGSSSVMRRSDGIVSCVRPVLQLARAEEQRGEAYHIERRDGKRRRTEGQRCAEGAEGRVQ